MSNFKFSVRTLRRSPGFTFTAVAVLAIGIASNTAIFTVVNAVILRPLPFANSDRIVNIGRRGPGGSASVPMFTFWEGHNPGLENMAAWMSGSNLNLNDGGNAEVVAAMRASRNYFPLFGANPILGRTFTAEEDRPGGPPVAVMSYGLWQRGFGGDSSILHHTVRLGGAAYAVVGVLSPGFAAYPPCDIWLPLQANPQSTDQAHVLYVGARLPDGMRLAQASAKMAVVGKQFVQWSSNPIVGNDDQIQVTRLQDQLTGNVRPALMILMGAVGLVLMIACVNVANLLLARAAARHREIAIRTALGATRGRIIRSMLTESLLLAFAGGISGLALGWCGVRMLVRLAPADLPRAQEITALDPRVVAFAVFLAAATGLLFGFLPAVQSARSDLGSVLKTRSRARGILVSAEVAIALVLLCGAALLIRSFTAMHAVNLGFDPHNLLTMEVSLAGPGYASGVAVAQLGREFVDRVERLPGVESAALASALPLEGGQDMLFSIPGKQPLKGYHFTGDVQWLIVSSHYFNVLRIPLLAGRYLRERETGRTVVISQTMARRYWPNGNPVGQTIMIGPGLGPGYDAGATEIVGVVGDVPWRLNVEPASVMYQAPSQILDAAMALVNRLQPAGVLIRTHQGVGPMSLGRAARQLLLESDQLPASKLRTMEQVSADSTARQNFNLLLLGSFAAIALVLAAAGVYGVMSYSVEQRTHEIGIRSALGARHRDTVLMVLGQAARMAAAGVAIGLVASFGLMRLLRAELFGVTPSDPLTFTVAAAVLLAIALTAACVPALRAVRVDPLVALRHE
jgi:putative ABC transport system permease protein